MRLVAHIARHPPPALHIGDDLGLEPPLAVARQEGDGARGQLPDAGSPLARWKSATALATRVS